MARQQELTVRIPTAGTVAGAIAWFRQQSGHTLRVEVADDGAVTVRKGPGAFFLTSAYLRGRIIDDGRGPVLTGAVRKVSHGTIWQWLMGIPAVFLLVCSSASMLFDGIHPGPLFIGIPGALALGSLSWYMIRQQEQEFRSDVASMRRHLEEMVTDDPDDD
jgi:hypothetical protein